jgi:hypothetical protein
MSVFDFKNGDDSLNSYGVEIQQQIGIQLAKSHQGLLL